MMKENLIFCRINYELINAYSITIDEAEKFHSIYHCDNPRRVSEGYCHNCNTVVTIIPYNLWYFRTGFRKHIFG